MEYPVAEEICDDGCRQCAKDDRPSRARPERDQHTGRDARRWPENGNPFRFGQERKPEAGSKKICDRNRDREQQPGCNISRPAYKAG